MSQPSPEVSHPMGPPHDALDPDPEAAAVFGSGSDAVRLQAAEEAELPAQDGPTGRLSPYQRNSFKAAGGWRQQTAGYKANRSETHSFPLQPSRCTPSSLTHQDLSRILKS